MPLLDFKCTDFRCFEEAALSLDLRYNLIYGANASGKTSLLEAMAYLGRGRSFRGATPQNLVRHGAREFLLFGHADASGREVPVGVRNSRDGLEIKIDGDKSRGAADLAAVLPLQVVDPDIHDLVAGGPEQRRRYIDWVAFHVEHGYLEDWRRFRRALRQRNAALKSAASPDDIAGWDRELLAAGARVHEARLRVIDVLQPAVQALGGSLLLSEVDITYQQGWSHDLSLEEALAAARERDRQIGSTQAGPHRADLKLSYHERQARRIVSRGQQKLLACGLILAATEIVQTHLEQRLVLLLDDPAAELDAAALDRLMTEVLALDTQVIATSLDVNPDLFPDAPRLFHVEHGQLHAVD